MLEKNEEEKQYQVQLIRQKKVNTEKKSERNRETRERRKQDGENEIKGKQDKKYIYNKIICASEVEDTEEMTQQ